jgi:hypothetical protein
MAFNPVDNSMPGNSTAQANGVLCNPARGVATGILITAFGKAGVNTGDTGAVQGVSGLTCSQVGGVTTLAWTRPFRNGMANYAQLSTTGPTRTQCVAGATHTHTHACTHTHTHALTRSRRSHVHRLHQGTP